MPDKKFKIIERRKNKITKKEMKIYKRNLREYLLFKYFKRKFSKE